GLLMSLESTGARCEQMAQHMLIHGTPFDPADMVRRIDAVDNAAIARVVAGWHSAPPTLTALGPIGRLEDFDRLKARRGARSRVPTRRGRSAAPLSPPVPGPVRPVPADRRPRLPASARTRRLRGMGEHQGALALLSRSL